MVDTDNMKPLCVLVLLPAVLLAGCASTPEEVAEVSGTLEISSLSKIYVGATEESFRGIGESCDGLQFTAEGLPDSRYTVRDEDNEVLDSGSWGTLTEINAGPLGVSATCTWRLRLTVPESVEFVQLESGDFEETYDLSELVEGIEDYLI